MEQNYKNHSRLVTGYHRVLAILLLAGLIGSIINLKESIETETYYSASLIVLLFGCSILIYWYTRSFPLKAQDRAIRAEENFRHYILTGKPLPSGLHIRQIIALRFASDEEFPALVQKALAENLTSKAIKQAIQNWKPDYYRV
ncbi:DUF6526 family protein [Daejeonella sp. H1SJ63]|jgi:hypothetical protein|uniref:DUF6526 family protein n=1 Tax=Daejeonella sp. H1SJ63 TaxID=3034145 RepID=UPI0023EAB0DB|nr:DUF6526 family protein [Daejeonella sp. H1SJ63]